MDIKEIKKKLDALNKASERREFTDNSKFFWKPGMGKHTIRIVPSMYNPDFPFTELKFHYGVARFPMIALSNFGKQDPVEDFIKELKKTSDKENWSLAGKLTPKPRIFVPVIVRGEEDQGVRLWGFGVTVYKALLSLAEDEDIGDYTDVTNGWDLIVEKVQGTKTYPETTVRIKPKQLPLSDDAKLVEKWLKTQPDPFKMYDPLTYDEMKKELKKYVNPDEDEENTPEVDNSSKYTLEDNTEDKKDIEDTESKGVFGNFDDLFND